MKYTVYWIQSLVLLVGTFFAFSSVTIDYVRFYGIYHSLTRIQNCAIPNPILTPCFYGAFAFLFASIWSLSIIIKKRKAQQAYLHMLLIASTLFAWGNFFLGIYRYYTVSSGPKVSCSGIPTTNPFLTPCLGGSIIFLIALCLSFYIVKKQKKIQRKR